MTSGPNSENENNNTGSAVTTSEIHVDRNAPVNDKVDLKQIEKAVRMILGAVGEDPDRDGLLETPARVARMYKEMFAGLHSDPGRHLSKVFEEEYDEIVLVRDISFCSMCEHHLLPFTGRAHIAYLPSGNVVGLSKLARVVEEVARRPQVQERLTPHRRRLSRGAVVGTRCCGRLRSHTQLHDNARRAKTWKPLYYQRHAWCFPRRSQVSSGSAESDQP